MRALSDPIGKKQPPLTEDEVIAAIRGWDQHAPASGTGFADELLTAIRSRNQPGQPATDEVYAAFQKIAATHDLPNGAELRFKTVWIRENYHFDVWWVDLSIPTGRNGGGYVFRIRDQKLRALPARASR